MSAPKVSIVTTHPIQYQIPWFRALQESEKVELNVFFGVLPDDSQQGLGFGTEFSWDIPMLEGYKWSVLENKARNPSLESFSGCTTPGIADALISTGTEILIVTGWNSKMLLQATLAANKLGIPTIVRGESNSLKSRSIIKKVFHRLLLRKFDRFLSIGTHNKTFYINNGVDESNIFHSPYFIENKRFVETISSDSFNRESQRTKTGVPEKSYCFLYSGKLSEKKHVLDLVKAFKIVFENNFRVHFLVVGDGEHRQQLGNYANKYNLPVTFAGFVNQTEIPKMYGSADCLLLGSDYDETWGLVVNEAMVCGIPAIVSDRAGCSTDLVIPETTGYRYTFGDIAGLVTSMNKVSTDDFASAAMGRKAQTHVLKNFNVSLTVDATIQAISSVHHNNSDV